MTTRVRKHEQWFAGLAVLIRIATLATVVGLLHLLRTPNSPYFFPPSREALPHLAWANSVFRFGPNENSALVGTDLRYHWFSYLAQANTRWIAGLEPATLVHSGLWTTICIIVTTLLLVGTAEFVGLSRRFDMVVVVLAWGSVLLGEPATLIETSDYVASPWTVPFALAGLVVVGSRSLRGLPFVTGALSLVTVLSNGPAGLVVVMALVATPYLGSLNRRSPSPVLHLHALIPLGGALIGYVLFLQPRDGSPRAIEFTADVLSTRLGLVTVLLLFICRLGQPIGCLAIKNDALSLLGLGWSSLAILWFLFERNSSAQLSPHFALPALTIAPVVGAIVLEQHLGRRSCWHVRARASVVLLLCATLLGVMSSLAYHAVMAGGFLWPRRVLFVEFSPLLVAVFITILSLLMSRSEVGASRRGVPRTAWLTVGAGLWGLIGGWGIGHVVRADIREAIGHYYDLPQTNNNDDFVIDQIRVAEELRVVSAPSDIVATNALLGDRADDFFTGGANVDAGRSQSGVIAGVADRRVLIEGDAWGNVGMIYPQRTAPARLELARGVVATTRINAPRELLARIVASQRFGNRADPASARFLANAGVMWFVLDLRESSIAADDWPLVPGVRLVMRSGDVALLDMSHLGHSGN